MAGVRLVFMPTKGQVIVGCMGLSIIVLTIFPWFFPKLATGMLDLFYLGSPLAVWGAIWLRIVDAFIPGNPGLASSLPALLKEYWLLYGSLIEKGGLWLALKFAFSRWQSVEISLFLILLLWLWFGGLGVFFVAGQTVPKYTLRLLELIQLLREQSRFLKEARERARSFLARISGPRVEAAVRWLLEHALPYPASLFHHGAGIGGLFEHSLDVAGHALELAEKHNLDSNEREILVCAALLHDVGKVRLFAYQGPTTRWEGEEGTRGFFKFLRRRDYGPRTWIRLSRVKEEHPELGARIVAEEVFSPDEDRIFISRVVHLIREHHAEEPGKDKLLKLLVEADRVMTGEERNELKELVREHLRGVVRSFVPNLPVDGKIMLIWTPDVPDVIFVNSFHLRDKFLEFVRDLGFIVPQRSIFKKVSVVDQTIWEVIEEMGWLRRLPGVPDKNKLVLVKLGKIEFKMLPLAAEEFFTKEEIKRFPAYTYDVTLESIKPVAPEPQQEQAAQDQPSAPQASQPEGAEGAERKQDDPAELIKLWKERYGSEPVSTEQIAELAAELGMKVPEEKMALGRWISSLNGVKVDGAVARVQKERRTRKKKVQYVLELEQEKPQPQPSAKGPKVVKKAPPATGRRSRKTS